jgi:hypothetical protein
VISGPNPDPPVRPGRDLDNNGGGFLNFGPDDLGAAGRQQMREVLGEDGFARWQRSRELAENPRPLTDAERAALRLAAAPLLADLAASGMPRPDIRDEAHEEREAPSACGWIAGPGRTGEGISVLLDASPAEQIAQLAEQFQNWAADRLHDAGRSPEWPACPQHATPQHPTPQHPTPPHRLEPEVRDGRAVWTCAQSGAVISPIGELATSDGAPPSERRGHPTR